MDILYAKELLEAILQQMIVAELLYAHAVGELIVSGNLVPGGSAERGKHS